MRRLQHPLLVLEVRRRWRSLEQAFLAMPFRPCHNQHMGSRLRIHHKELSHMGLQLHTHRMEQLRKEQLRKEQHMLAQVHSSWKRDVPSGEPTNHHHSCGSCDR